ncbi:hypothetical protein F5Y06DRAFT_291634 [Hypoxylon sp. FL0890]|nr:hypothetical protein F5Y06DRAFT_291634 [Hypoxylon sp. FL0890]
MPGKRRLATEEELQKRAERKRIRTSYRTGATDKEKARALKVATDRLPGKKYSWMNQEKLTPAKTMGKLTAGECKITTGPIAEELGIGEHSRAATEFSEEYKKAQAEGLTSAEAERLVEARHVEHQTHTSAPASEPAPDPSPAVPVSAIDDEELEAMFMEIIAEDAKTTEQPKKHEEGAKENPVSLSSREPSPIIISSRDATPSAPSKKRKATNEPKAPKKKRAKKVRKEEPKEEAEEEYNEEEEMKDLEVFLKYAIGFLSG